MATLFPNALDAFTNPTGDVATNSPSLQHAAQHANANDAIEALQAKVGITGSAVVTSLEYRISNSQQKVLFTGAPLTPSSVGTQGTIIVEGGYLYVCTAANTWGRVQLSTVWG